MGNRAFWAGAGLGAVGLLFVGCSSEPTAGAPAPGTATPTPTGAAFPQGGPSTTPPPVAAPPTMTSTPMTPTFAPTAGSSAPTAPIGTLTPSATGTVAPTGDLPCEIDQIVQGSCQGCHGATPQFGAPMSLVTLADFYAMSPTQPTMTVAQSVMDRINRVESAGKMPPVSAEVLPTEALTALNGWLQGGHPAGTKCMDSGNIAPPLAPVETPVTQTPVAMSDPDVTCHEFKAHAPGSDAPYMVGRATDAYFNFPFNAPWKGTQYAKSFRVMIDNIKVVHHWLMYKDPTTHANAGTVAASIGAHPGGELVHGWAPGGEDLILEEGIGIAMPSTGFTLELHYNSTDANARDNSGLEICVTPNAPENTAAISWLGTDAISGSTASGVCTPATAQRIRILGGTPHMHTYGKSMKVEILRASGAIDVIHDKPFDFDYQRAYDMQDQDIWLEPGDSIRTTCNWTRPVTFGEGTGDEMCYFFTLHYPALALAAPGLDDVIHGPNTCGVL